MPYMGGIMTRCGDRLSACEGEEAVGRLGQTVYEQWEGSTRCTTDSMDLHYGASMSKC